MALRQLCMHQSPQLPDGAECSSGAIPLLSAAQAVVQQRSVSSKRMLR